MGVSQKLSLSEVAVGDPKLNANYSTVRILWESTQTGESWNGYTRTAKYYISKNGGAETEYLVSYTLPQRSTVTIVDTKIYVPHKDDGSGSITVRTWMDTDISTGVVTLTRSLDLTLIPRASSLVSLTSSSSYFNKQIIFKYSTKSENFYNRCNIALNLDGVYTAVKTINLGQKKTATQTQYVSLTESELSKIYNKLPSAKKGTLRFTLRTYLDSEYTSQIGDADYKEIELTIPNDTTTQPTMAMTLSPVSDFSSSSTIYVKGLSKVKASFTSEAAKYGATIASYKLTVSGKDYDSPYTSDYLATSGSVTVTGTVTDSRGYSGTCTQTINVIDYKKPSIDSLSCNTIYFDGTHTYKYTPANAVFYSRCIVALNISDTYTEIRDIKLGVKSASQQTETVKLEESDLSTIYEKIPNGTKGTLRYTLRTYIDSDYSTQVGEASYKEISLNIPDIDATKPTATLNLAHVSSLASPFKDLYIKGKSKVKVDLEDRAGKYKASIVSYNVSVDGYSATPPYTSEYFYKPGEVKVTGTVTDSRGYSRTYTETIPVIDYGPPQILPASGESEVIVARCDSSGNLSDTGTYLKIKARRYYSKVVSSNVQKNFCALQYRYKENGGSYSSWTTILATTAASDEVVTGALVGTFDIAKSYSVQIRAIDDIGESSLSAATISTEKVYRHKAGSMNAYALGKYAEDENTFDVAEDWTAIFRGDVRFAGEEWVSLPLGTNVAASSVYSGRWGGSGVYYRVCAGGKHIYVAFNVSFTTSSSTVRAESYTIPYPPNYDVYALCPVGFADGSRGIATVSISPKGIVNIYAVHKLPGATLSTGETVNWIDGYIDYWT